MLPRDHTVKVLDHGYVKLLDWMGSDEDIIVAARQSTGRSFEGWGPGKICKHCRHRPDSLKGQGLCEEATGRPDYSHVWGETKGDLGLLKTLWSKGHSTPFEMVTVKFQVQAPVMVYREWHRHRTQSFSEMSARYVQMPNLHYVPAFERIQGQSKTNKQGSDGALHEDTVRLFRESIESEQQQIYGNYDEHLKDGVSRELARLNTPVSRYSRMVVSANLLNWFRFLGLRMPEDAQYEIRQYANVIGDMIRHLCPRSWDLFEEFTLHSKRLSRTELSEARDLTSYWLDILNKEPAQFPDDFATDLKRLQSILGS